MKKSDFRKNAAGLTAALVSLGMTAGADGADRPMTATVSFDVKGFHLQIEGNKITVSGNGANLVCSRDGSGGGDFPKQGNGGSQWSVNTYGEIIVKRNSEPNRYMMVLRGDDLDFVPYPDKGRPLTEKDRVSQIIMAAELGRDIAGCRVFTELADEVWPTPTPAPVPAPAAPSP